MTLEDFVIFIYLQTSRSRQESAGKWYIIPRLPERPGNHSPDHPCAEEGIEVAERGRQVAGEDIGVAEPDSQYSVAASHKSVVAAPHNPAVAEQQCPVGR